MTDPPLVKLPASLPPDLADRLEPKPNGAGAPPSGSLLAKLRDAAGRQRERRRLELDVPGAFKGLLRIRYHGLPLDQVERYAELATSGQAANLTLTMDMLCTCCEAVLVNDPDKGWVVLEDDRGPVGLDARLARLLGDDGQGPEPSPVEVVEALMIVDDNAAPMGAHVSELAAWLTDPEGLEPGESSAATGPSRSAAPPSSG